MNYRYNEIAALTDDRTACQKILRAAERKGDQDVARIVRPVLADEHATSREVADARTRAQSWIRMRNSNTGASRREARRMSR